jgi:hypothetical protein
MEVNFRSSTTHVIQGRLRHMHDNALTGNTLLLENVPCAILPAQFVRIWRKWISRPAEGPRPEMVDNSQFLCEHGHLIFDPNCPNDWDTSIAVVQMTEWTLLADLCVVPGCHFCRGLMTPIIGIPAALPSRWKKGLSKRNRTYLTTSLSMTSQCAMTVVRRGGYF